MASNAVGIIEVEGLAAALAAADAGVKTAGVTIARRLKSSGKGWITIIFEGDVAAVQAAMDAAAGEARKIGTVLGVSVIPRPSDGLELVLGTAAPPAAASRRRRTSKSSSDSDSKDNGG